ncbi:MAG: prephenate dehydrogenase, partial [Anaerolineales bacterium]|nr:prephenate dehydrogenase [Anaerolineales bacterium]
MKPNTTPSTNALSSQRVTIIGLGLMGGSLALALRGRVAHLTAVERHAATRQYALQQQVVNTVTDNLALGVKDADIVIFATPVQTILHLIPELPALRPEGCLVFDLGSTKTAICQAMEQLPDSFTAVGGHPMCGKEVAGLDAADANLYRGQTFILTRTQRTSSTAEALALEIIDAIGANPLLLPAALHDQMVAAISHLPYLVSSVLMSVVAEQAEGKQGDERLWQVSASGFRDASRLSGSDPAMMRDILLTNKTAILQQLAHYQQRLTAVTALLE